MRRCMYARRGEVGGGGVTRAIVLCVSACVRRGGCDGDWRIKERRDTH